MGVIEFGAALIKSRDLDPMYCAVAGAGLDQNTKLRLMLAYVCLYHLGAASKIAEKKGAAFWKLLHEAAVNEGLRWPRGSERRHWRGAQALKSYESLESNAKVRPESLVEFWALAAYPDQARTFRNVSERVQRLTGFGPWIAFKIADICDRVLGYPVDFSNCELGIYKEPRAGGAIAFQELEVGQLTQNPADYRITDDELRRALKDTMKALNSLRLKAPPYNDRPIGVAEVETVWCKYKSHLKGSYPLGKDSRELRHQLEGWGDLAQQIQAHVPIYKGA